MCIRDSENSLPADSWCTGEPAHCIYLKVLVSYRIFIFSENRYYINEGYQGDACLEEEESVITRMICNSSTQDGHQHAAEMRDDRLDREIRPFAPGAYTVHCCRIDHDRRHPVAAPQKENPAVEHGRRRMHVGESEEVKCRHQDKRCV